MTRYLTIANAGATGNLMVKNAPVINVKPAENLITITLTNGQTIQPTHTYNLNIPWLPAIMTEAHIVPGMARLSLILIKNCFDGGCKVTYDSDEVKVVYNNQLVLSGGRNSKTGLWCLPIEGAERTANITDKLDLQVSPA